MNPSGASGSGRFGSVDEQLVDAALDLREVLLERLDLVADRVRLGDRVGGLLAGALCLRDPLRELLLRAPALLDLR